LKEVKRWIGEELFNGAVYGLGMSFAVWIPLSTGALADSWIGPVCLLAALAGLSRRWAGWPAPAALPWILAAWQLEGAAAATLVGVLAAAGSGAAVGQRRSGGRLAFDMGAATLAVVAADGIAIRGGGMAPPEILFGSVFVLFIVILHKIRRRLAGAEERKAMRNVWLSVAILAAALTGSWAIVWLWSVHPVLRVWLVIVPALRVGVLIGSWAARANERREREHDPLAPDRIGERTAAALARTLPEGEPGGHLWRTEALCGALAERLGADPVEIRYLRQAALLHHVGRVAYEDPSIEVHPRVVDVTVRQLGFTPEVRTILSHSQEHWNGDGPQGLSGERIARGARILAVADRYDQLTHRPSGTRPHGEAMALLWRESGERYDSLMFEILDELADSLEATGADLTRDPASATETLGGTRFVEAERDLQTLYSIERAVALPITLRERLTLVAGLLRSVVPFERLCVAQDDRESFVYGDRDAAPGDRVVALIHAGEEVGRLTMTIGKELDASSKGFLDRVAPLLASMISADGQPDSAGLTDPATGLPNAVYLRRMLAVRIPEPETTGARCSLIALHVRDLGDMAQRRGKACCDRFLQIVAQRLAAACDERETAVRLGPDQFVVLTAETRGGELVRRWNDLVEQVGRDPIELDGHGETLRLDASHAAHPIDGECLDDLLRTLETRLSGSNAATVLPFRDRVSAAQ